MPFHVASVRPRRLPVPPVALLACLLLLAAAPGEVAAQLPSSMLQASGRLDAAQQRTLAEFVQAETDRLVEADPKAVSTAKRNLLAPITRRESTRIFRLAYAGELVPRLDEIIEDPDAPMSARINARRIAGSLATDESVPILEGGLDAESEAIRYAAALGYMRAFEAIAADRHALNLRLRVPEMLGNLERAAGAESSPFVLRAALDAIRRAADRSAAMAALNTALQRQFARAADDEPTALARQWAGGLRDGLRLYIEMIGENAAGLTETRELFVTASAAALLVATSHAAEHDLEDPALRDAYAELVRTAENVLNLVLGLEPADVRVSRAFDAGNAAAAEAAVEAIWLAEGGPIDASPEIDLAPADIRAALEP